eukprot:CAMPEP_0174358962 /NCGR_PEP_ID=MMETSP0811_2-20130205/45645_1 /TAXON_ID=73025 ORGANISM="Eutreptiella gymnastica-like, Strain CCMP1594" /NCGR_SAMPLE_ID=MMETSP0811_2 /ASSEMBLY_ACC=CAM_ASM_000667 /LENGTH=30 /DNA_ID= /DNA_START= /DNA_END= /DNA_ORIENTATION=
MQRSALNPATSAHRPSTTGGLQPPTSGDLV